MPQTDSPPIRKTVSQMMHKLSKENVVSFVDKKPEAVPSRELSARSLNPKANKESIPIKQH